MDVFNGAIKVIIVSIVFFGLGAYGYSFKRDTFDQFPLITLYTVTVICTFCVVYLRDIYMQISSGEFDINNVGKLYSNLNVLAGILSFVVHIFYVRRHIDYINTSRKHLFRMIAYLDDNDGRIEKGVFKVAIKVFFFPILLQATLIVRALHFEPEKSHLWTFYALLPYVIRTVPATSVYGMLLIAEGFVEVINVRVQLAVDEINQMKTHKEWLCKTPFQRMQRYCDLSDTIDLLNELNNYVFLISNELLEFSSLPWLCSLLCNVVGIMSGCFTQYMTIADTIFNGKEYDYYSVLTDSALMFISFMEIYSQSGACSASLEQVRQTGIILQKADITGADVRLREAIEFYSLRIILRDYKIKPLGLIIVDWSLLHGVFATITSFLLILIQADLSRRFLQ